MKKRDFLRLYALLLMLWFIIPAQSQNNCALMRASVASGGWIACDHAATQVLVCNEGDQPANNARVNVVIPTGFEVVSSIPAPSLSSGQELQYFLGNMAPGNCTNIQLVLAVPCDVAEGQSFCVLADAFPRNCPATAPGWDGSSLVISGYCSAPDSVWFTVRNASSNPMTSGPAFIIIEDHLMRSSGNLPLLGAGDTTTISYPAPTGKTYTFQTSQTPGHPFQNVISLSVEGCGDGTNSSGYAQQYPQFRGHVSSHTFCNSIQMPVEGAQKFAFPTGYGDQHLIGRNNEIHYRVNFQNTGANTAQTVVIVDTLSEFLDLNTLRMGAASHAYTYTLQGRTLTVQVSNLQLPPAAINPSASRGFVSFHIQPAADIPLGTIIQNTAEVSTGGAPMVTTGMVFHQIGENFILTSGTSNPAEPGFSLQIMPNPMRGHADLLFSGLLANETITMYITDIAGQHIQTLQSENGQIHITKGDWPAGVYFYSCTGEHGRRMSGRLVVLD